VSRVFASIRWLLGASLARKVLVFGLFLVLARELPKEVFGWFGEYVQLLSVLLVLSAFSLEYLHVVERNRTNRNYSALVGLPFVFGLVITAALESLAPWIARLYHAPELTHIIRLTAPILLIHILRRAAKNHLQREMRFRAISICETANVICYTALGLIWLKLSRSYWALFGAFFLGDVLETLMLTGRDRFWRIFAAAVAPNAWPAHLRVLRESFRFCLTTLSANLLSLVGTNAPILVLGMFLAPDRIGVYFAAWTIMAAPLGLFTDTLQRVFFPTFSAADETARRRQVERFTDFTIAAAWAVFAYYTLAMQLLLPILATRYWIDAVPLLPLLFGVTCTTVLINPLSSIPIVLKRPQVDLAWTAVSASLKTAALVVGGTLCAHGAMSFGAVIGVYCLVTVVMAVLLLAIIFRMLGVSIRRQVGRQIPPILLQAAMIVGFQEMSVWWGAWSLIPGAALLGVYLLVIDRIRGGCFRKELRGFVSRG
jgi:O-antigen/teichoic acid export membrane protein